MPTITPFHQQIYDLARRIPRGSVCTYAEMARAAGCGSARAVGQALKRNPFAPEVPCHRVISSNLGTGGFQGKTEGPTIRKKLELLASEGVMFTASGRLADAARLFRFPI